MGEEHVQKVNLATADDFFKEISATSKRFGEFYNPENWLYRGHADARWPLLPTALRPDTFLSVGEWISGPCKTNLDQIKAEAKLALNFFLTADSNGLPLPEDSQSLRRSLKDLSTLQPSSAFLKMLGSGESLWPPDELLSLFALGQHHGLPTRLLDWTKNAHVAAYFAAAEAATWLFKPDARKRKEATHLCIWAIARLEFTLEEILAKLPGSIPPRIKVVTTPSAGNPNLRAQNALFLVDRPHQIDPNAAVDTRPWDVLLKESFPSVKGREILQQLCLPIEEAPRLLRLLAFEGITAATVFPGFNGVVSALKERRYWEYIDEAMERGYCLSHS